MPNGTADARSVDALTRIKALAAKEFSLDETAINASASLDSLGIDSLSFIEFMFKIEEEFGVTVSDEDLKQIKTLADLERHITSSLGSTRKA